MYTKNLFHNVCTSANQNLATQAAKIVVGSLAINALGRGGAIAISAAAIPVVSGIFLIDKAISLITED